MTDRKLMDTLNAELAALNKGVEDAISARKEWMDAHMADYAKFKIGDVIYNAETGQWAGQISKYYRYRSEDPRNDTSMSIEYEFETRRKSFDNTSRQPFVRFTTAQQMLDSGRYRANEKELWERRAADPKTVEKADQERKRMAQLLVQSVQDMHEAFKQNNDRK